MPEITEDRQITIGEIKSEYSERRCTDVQQLLSTMANPIRFRILCALRVHSFTVSELVEVTDSNLSNVSQHLKMMWIGGYIEKVRRGKQVYYNLAENRISDVITLFEEMYPPERYNPQRAGCD